MKKEATGKVKTLFHGNNFLAVVLILFMVTGSLVISSGQKNRSRRKQLDSKFEKTFLLEKAKNEAVLNANN